MRARLVTGVLLGLCLSSGLSYAQQEEDEHSGHHPEAAASEAAPAAERAPAGMEQMKRIQGLMKKIRATDDESVRQELLKQHLQAMREQIAAMRAMAAPKGMGMMGKGGGTAGADEEGAKVERKSKESMGGGMMQMHKQMENRAGMLEMLIEQMLEREAVQDEISAED